MPEPQTDPVGPPPTAFHQPKPEVPQDEGIANVFGPVKTNKVAKKAPTRQKYAEAWSFT